MNDSSNPLRFRATPLVLELFVPLLVQAAAILVLLLLAVGKPMETLFALIVSVVWLKLSDDKSVQEFGELRAGRRLFAQIGTWLKRDDASAQFDKVLSETLMFEHNVEHEDYMALVTAKGVANFARNAMSFLLQAYMLVTVAFYFIGLVRTYVYWGSGG